MKPALFLAGLVLGTLAGRYVLQPVAVTIPVSVASPQVQAPDLVGLLAVKDVVAELPVIAEGRLRDRIGFVGLRVRLRAELDRRAELPEGDPLRITVEQSEKGKDLVGRLGDGHLLELLVKYGPEILKLVAAILALIAVL